MISSLLPKINGRRSCPVFAGSQLAGITMGQYPVPWLHQTEAILPNGFAYPYILFLYGKSLLLQSSFYLIYPTALILPANFFHPLQRPGQVDRRRPCRIQIILLLYEFPVKALIMIRIRSFCQKIDSESRRHSDRRRAAHS